MFNLNLSWEQVIKQVMVQLQHLTKNVLTIYYYNMEQ